VSDMTQPLADLGVDPLPVTELTEADLASVGLCPADLTPDRMAALEATRMSLASVARDEPPRHVVRRWHAALAQLPSPRPVQPGASDPAADEPDATPTAAVEPGTGEHGPADPALGGLVIIPPNSAEAGSAPSRSRLGRSRLGRSRLGRRRGGLAVLAAAAAGVLVLAWLGPLGDSADQRGGPVPAALPDQATARPDASPADRTGRALAGRDVPVGGQDYGPLADPGRRAGCLRRAGAGGVTPLAARQVSWSGRPAVLLVLPTPVPGQLRILVVTPDCGPDGGGTLADFPAGH
jgi:hypothetical protein